MKTVKDVVSAVGVELVGVWKNGMFWFNDENAKDGILSQIANLPAFEVILLIHGPATTELRRGGWYEVKQRFADTRDEDFLETELIELLKDYSGSRKVSVKSHEPRLNRADYTGAILASVGCYPYKLWFLDETDAVFNSLKQTA